MARVKCPHCFHVNPDQQAHCQKCNTLLPRIRIEAQSVINEAQAQAPRGNNSPQFRRGQVVGGRYTVLNLIGQGGMGSIYKVHDNTLGEDVALKTLLPQFLDDKVVLERFYNEAKIARRLAHENIVRVHDIGEDGKVLYISMEYLQGMSLREVIDNLKPGERLPIAQTLRIFDELCSALQYAHQFTIHRDIKPENVMLGQDGRVRLMDFGISKLMANTRLTGASVVMGTPFYMSPEQIRNSRDVDARSDIYSVGVMLYEILTGSVPTGIPKPASQIMKDVPPALDKIVVKCVDPNPKERYQNATELRNALLPIRQMVKSGTSLPKQEALSVVSRVYSGPKLAGGLLVLLVITAAVWGLLKADNHRKAVLAAAPTEVEPSGSGVGQVPVFADYEAVYDELLQRATPHGALSGGRALDEGKAFWADARAAAAAGDEARAMEDAGYAFQCLLGTIIAADFPSSWDMVFVSPGEVTLPGRPSEFVGAFLIDRQEVTLGQYRRFVQLEKTFGPVPAAFDSWGSDYNDYPISDVSCLDAMAFAAERGCDLPTEAQWTRAAAYGEEGGAGVWPDPLDIEEDELPLYNVNYASEVPRPAGQFPSDLSRFSCWNMAGNVAEWTRTTAAGPPTYGAVMTVCGNSFFKPYRPVDMAREQLGFEKSAIYVGFRCVKEIPSSPTAARAYLAR